MASVLFNASARSSLCRSCRTPKVQVGAFSSTAIARVGPESPNYIQVPASLQPDLPPKPRVKGTLPVPREIFPTRRPDKPSKAYIAAATTEPSKRRKKPKGTQPEYNEWKSKMAASRRRNLREGLVELYRRKERTVRSVAARSNAKQTQRDRLIHQRPRDDERLTSSTTPTVMQPKRYSVLPDPGRGQRLARSRHRVAAKERRKEAERKDSLHTLYMNARNFITTEEQLATELNRVFPDGVNEAWANDQRAGENIWNQGVPPTLQSMVNANKRGDAAKWGLVQKRVKKIAEELTGGKMGKAS